MIKENNIKGTEVAASVPTREMPAQTKCNFILSEKQPNYNQQNFNPDELVNRLAEACYFILSERWGK